MMAEEATSDRDIEAAVDDHGMKHVAEPAGSKSLSQVEPRAMLKCILLSICKGLLLV